MQPAKRIVLGDPVPWFGAPLIGDGTFNLSGRGRPLDRAELSGLAGQSASRTRSWPSSLRDAQLFDEDRIVFYGVFTAPPQIATPYVRHEHAGDLVPRRL